jgi:hypothetical protein
VPLDSLQRAATFDNFHIYQSTSLSDVVLAGNGKIVSKAGSRRIRFDYIIAAGVVGPRAHPWRRSPCYFG